MEILLGKDLGSMTYSIRILNTEIGIKGEFKKEYAPFQSFTFDKKQLTELKKLIDKELKDK